MHPTKPAPSSQGTKKLSKKELLAYLDKHAKQKEAAYAQGQPPDLTLRAKKTFTSSR